MLENVDFGEIMASYTTEKILDKTIESVQMILSHRNMDIINEENSIKKGTKNADYYIGRYTLETSNVDLEQQLIYNLKNAFNWSKDISFRDLPESRSILNTFIELDFYLTPRKLHYREFEEAKKIKLFKAICDSRKNIVILGGPGAGKTTIGKFLCISLLLKDEQLSVDYGIPLVIRLRDYNSLDTEKIGLFEIIESVLEVKIGTSGVLNERRDHLDKTKFRIISKVIDELRLLIIIDGFDEIVNAEFKKKVIRDFNDLCKSVTESRIILTSRAADFNYRIDNTWVYEICPLSKDQINEFTSKWVEDEKRAQLLQQQIYNSPFADTAMRPLTLAHLCAIFTRYNKIPDKPKSVYKKVISLLLEEWDSQRLIERKSKYSNFEVDRKIEFLSKLAYELTTRYSTFTFSKNDLEKCYRLISKDFKLPSNEMDLVLNEIESHNGLFLQCGNDAFEFAHKSLQEFLTGEYIRGLDEIPANIELLTNIPNELAIATTLSSNQSSFFGKIVLQRLKQNFVSNNFLIPYLTRLNAEKPDFVIDAKLGLSFLLIYSSFVSKYISQRSVKLEYSGYASMVPYFGKTINLIDQYLSLNEVEESIKRLAGYYKISGSLFNIHSINPQGHYLIENIKVPKGLTKSYMPLELIISERYFEIFNRNEM